MEELIVAIKVRRRFADKGWNQSRSKERSVSVAGPC
jgi:hypothetical protein